MPLHTFFHLASWDFKQEIICSPNPADHLRNERKPSFSFSLVKEDIQSLKIRPELDHLKFDFDDLEHQDRRNLQGTFLFMYLIYS